MIPVSKRRRLSDEMHRRASYRRGMRVLALTVTLVLGSVAFATVLRPRHGYTSEGALLAGFAGGLGVGLGALALIGVAVAATRRRERSVWAIVTAAPTLGAVIAVFVVAAAVSQIAPAVSTSLSRPASSRAGRNDFQRWQATVVPIAVSWMHTVRVAQAFEHDIPQRGLVTLRRRVIDAGRTLDHLGRTLTADAPSLPQRPRLRRLTAELEAAVSFARRGCQAYVLSLAGGAGTGGHHRKARLTRRRTLINRGNSAIRASLSIMTTFSLQANRFGTSLFATPG